jgi:hypothetical protein
MAELPPRAGIVAVGVLAGFAGGLLLAGILVAGRQARPGAVPASLVVAPNPTVVTRTVPGTVPSPSTVTEFVPLPAPSNVTVVERQTVTHVEPAAPIPTTTGPGAGTGTHTTTPEP